MWRAAADRVNWSLLQETERNGALEASQGLRELRLELEPAPELAAATERLEATG